MPIPGGSLRLSGWHAVNSGWHAQSRKAMGVKDSHEDDADDFRPVVGQPGWSHSRCRSRPSFLRACHPMTKRATQQSSEPLSDALVIGNVEVGKSLSGLSSASGSANRWRRSASGRVADRSGG